MWNGKALFLQHLTSFSCSLCLLLCTLFQLICVGSVIGISAAAAAAAAETTLQ